MQHVVS